MSHEPQLPARRYNEKEVALLLKRTADLQRATPSVPDPAGLTLRELEEIASEAGLDSALLRQAAAELDRGSAGDANDLGSRLAGAPVRIALELSVPGVMPESEYAELIPTILAAADRPGIASQVGQTFTWSSQQANDSRRLHVLISSTGGTTRIHVEERYGGLAGAIFSTGVAGVGLGIGGGLGGALGGILSSLPIGLGIPAILLSLSYVGSRSIYRRVVYRRRAVLERLLQDLAARVARSAPQSPTLPPPANPVG